MTSRLKLMPSPHWAQTTRGPLKPGRSSGWTSTYTHCLSKRISSESCAYAFCWPASLPSSGNISRAACLEDSLAAIRTARPLWRSTKVAATLPQSRNFRARLPRRQLATSATASVTQRSISTYVTSRLRSAKGSSIPSSRRPSIARRTPRTCPAQRWPCATAARSRYSARVFIGASSSFLRGGPGVGLARFDEGEDGHQERESDERAVTENRFDGEGLGSGKAPAIDLHAKRIRTHHGHEESQHDQSDESGPDAESPADEQQKTEPDFREGQRVGDKFDAPRWKNLIGIHVQRKEGKGYADGRARVHAHRQLGIARIDEEASENEAADPDDHAAGVHWARLHHDVGLFAKLPISD